jgi:DNA-binding response OmpR family regulator
VLTRQEILRHVWGYDYDPQSNVVDVYIGYLRRKIDRNFDRPLLHTLVNVGYKLEG